jgi:SAM-dependent methyltransferase
LAQSRNKPKESRRSPSYEAIGQFYDDLWGETPRAWTSARGQLLEPALSRAHKVCELGCGTGITATDFARRGLKVFALDFSREMCRITREKALAERLDVRVARADMRNFRVPAQVDLVTSEWGVINHLPRRADLLRTFRAVARALRPGGYFYFDLHQRRVYEEQWSGASVGDGVTRDGGREFFAAQWGGFDRKSGKGWTEMTVFVKRAGKFWERRSERVEEIYWPHGDIVRDLGRAGFQLLRIFDFVSEHYTPSPKKVPGALRTMYLARKKDG